MKADPFLEFVLEQMAALEDLESRPMFGGHGLYRGETFFGIVYGGRLFFRTTEGTRGRYVDLGMAPFRPSEKQTLRTYYEVPADVVEDKAALVRWAEEAAAGADVSKGR